MGANRDITAESKLISAMRHEIIPTLDETFDLVFIDADKPNYANYYDLVFPKLRIGGMIFADNVLWSGKVLDVGKRREHRRKYVGVARI